MKDEVWKEFVRNARGSGQLIESVIRDFYCSYLDVAGCAVDGGAHLASHTKPLSSHLAEGNVLAVEANPKTYRKLVDRTKDIENVECINAALQDKEEVSEVSFNPSSSHPGRSGISRLWDVIAPKLELYDEPITVPATTIDCLVGARGLKRVDFIKLDLEGGEYFALKGGMDSLMNLRPVVVTEHSIHAPRVNGFSVEQYFEFLAVVDYVPVSPRGNIVTQADPFPFWYIFLTPAEITKQVKELIEEAIEPYVGRNQL